jgi:hypothetical protein
MDSYHLPLWRGYARRYEKTSQKPLRDTLKSASRQLTKLKLSLGDQCDSIDEAQTLKDNEEDYNFFVRNVLRISLENMRRSFPHFNSYHLYKPLSNGLQRRGHESSISASFAPYGCDFVPVWRIFSTTAVASTQRLGPNRWNSSPPMKMSSGMAREPFGVLIDF